MAAVPIINLAQVGQDQKQHLKPQSLALRLESVVVATSSVAAAALQMITYPEADEKESYAGSLFNGLYSGYGTLTWKNGAKYCGEWREGQMTGKGKFTFPESDSRLEYEGMLIRGEFSEPGQMRWKNGNTYAGALRNGRKEGWGVYYSSASGKTYRGNFSNNLPEGRGYMSSKNEDRIYDGEWKEGKMHGEGTWVKKGTDAHGSYTLTYQGTFEMGEIRTGSCHFKYLNGNISVGEYVFGKKSGKWVSNFNGFRYEGFYVKGKKEGTWVIHGPNEWSQIIKYENDREIQ